MSNLFEELHTRDLINTKDILQVSHALPTIPWSQSDGLSGWWRIWEVTVCSLFEAKYLNNCIGVHILWF